MPYNISATADIGPILSRRNQPRRALAQARAYQRRGYQDVRILDVETGEVFDVRSFAGRLPTAEVAAAG